MARRTRNIDMGEVKVDGSVLTVIYVHVVFVFFNWEIPSVLLDYAPMSDSRWQPPAICQTSGDDYATQVTYW